MMLSVNKRLMGYSFRETEYGLNMVCWNPAFGAYGRIPEISFRIIY